MESRILLEFDRAPRINVVDALKDRGYIYVDIYGMDTSYRRRLLPFNDGRVRAVDAISYPSYNVLRLVVYASIPTLKYRVVQNSNPHSLTISLWDERIAGDGTQLDGHTVNPSDPSEEFSFSDSEGLDAPQIPEPNASMPQLRSGVVKTVIIDPGHGGANTGAKSRVPYNGQIIPEKQLTFEFSYHLKRLLDQAPNIVALVTRTDDRVVSLADRVKFAEANDGDLFISIHKNDGAGNASARGMEVYYLNDRGTVTGAVRAVEERENRDYGVDSEPIAAGSLVRAILTDMERRKLADFRFESYNFCRAIESNLLQIPYFRRHNRGVKSANFVVLRNFKMPAVLLEVGFISNADELRYLMNQDFQRATAVALFNAINDYFADTDPSFEPNRLALPQFDELR
jgi:N-acetylmuramoyl-L-alanine amidase